METLLQQIKEKVEEDVTPERIDSCASLIKKLNATFKILTNSTLKFDKPPPKGENIDAELF